MKQLLDFLPLIVFFVFYKLYDIYVASGALIAATALALIFTWVKYRKVEKMTLILCDGGCFRYPHVGIP